MSDARLKIVPRINRVRTIGTGEYQVEVELSSEDAETSRGTGTSKDLLKAAALAGAMAAWSLKK